MTLTSDAEYRVMSNVFNNYFADYDIPVQMGEDVSEHWPTEIEINEFWNPQDAFEKILKFHSITALTKYIRLRPLLCVTDIDEWRMKDLFQRIFLSSDPENLVNPSRNWSTIACIYRCSRVSSCRSLRRNGLDPT